VEGGYRLNGAKLFITSGGEADLYTVFATVAPEMGKKGITAFLVEKGTPGLFPGPRRRRWAALDIKNSFHDYYVKTYQGS